MNLTHAEQLLSAWGKWVNAEYEKLSYSAPQYNSDYEAGYRHEPSPAYPESSLDMVNVAIKRLCAQDRAILKGIYLDGIRIYIEKAYSQIDRESALRHFLNEYEAREVA